MATIDAVVNQTPAALPPIDPNVKIPDHVKKASELANSFYQKTEPTPDAPAKDALEQPAQPEPLTQAQPEPKPAEPVQTPLDAGQPQPTSGDEDPNNQSWQHKFLSMQGRWRASQATIGQMQEQMSQLGDELVRTQALIESGRHTQVPQNQQENRPDHKKLITDEDREAYGDSLIDLARRAAMETVGPEIDALRSENQTLKQRVITGAQREVNGSLSRVVPNWVQINRSPEFKSWLRLRNIYTGRVRQEMLNEAYAAADAPKVLAFFQDFLREEVATGRMQQPVTQNEPHKEPSSAPDPAPRTAALSLDALTAPGRAKPAPGDSPAGPADKPTFTRAQISQFYADVRRQVYVGREAEKAQLEQLIFAAQNSGRIR